MSSVVFLIGTTGDTEDTERQVCLRRFQKMEVSAGSVHIARYLFAQRIHRGEFNLIAQALQKINLYFRVGRQFYGMKVQKVSFDRE